MARSIACCSRFTRRGKEFPPSVDGILAWSQLFRSAGTFGNYVSYVRLGCQILGVSDAACSGPHIKRAKASIEKLGGFVRRKRMFVKHDTVLRMVRLAATKTAQEWIVAMLFLASYVFLLRLPSEALPMTSLGVGSGHGEQSVIQRVGDTVCLKLRRRKNRPSGSVLSRACWCQKSPETCPVHVLWPFFESCGVNVKPFVHITPRTALWYLRSTLNELRVPESHIYNTRDFRRGHTQV